jgi:hypothetical protein
MTSFHHPPFPSQNHPPPPRNVQISQVLTIVQYSSLATLFFGDSIFAALNMHPPGLYLQARENRTWTAFLIFMLGNQLINGLTVTGAFEIEVGHIAAKCLNDHASHNQHQLRCAEMVDSQIVFSKLTEGRMPEPQEVLQLVGAELKKFSIELP